MKIISINIASPEKISLDGDSRKIKSGIFKSPVSGSIELGYLGFHGDGVGDTKIHGGKDKAVCAYCVDHFSYWNNKLQRQLIPGAFGENISLSGMSELEINIGDIFETGTAQVQVTQPRQPCHKLNKVFGEQDIACDIKKNGYSGYYFRVLTPGFVKSGMPIKVLKKDPAGFSIEKANALLRKGGTNTQHLKELLSLTALSEEWRAMIQKRLEKAEN